LEVSVTTTEVSSALLAQASVEGAKPCVAHLDADVFATALL
jgi:hypothetical protein